jgi:hypothetical protein
MSLMAENTRHVHIIDSDYARRAKVAREFHKRAFHPEIYEDLAEFEQRPSAEGFVFVADEPAIESASNNVTHLLRADDKALPIVLYAGDPKPERIVSAMLDGNRLSRMAFQSIATERHLQAFGDRWGASPGEGSCSGRGAVEGGPAIAARARRADALDYGKVEYRNRASPGH